MKAIVTQKRHEGGWLRSDSGCGHGLCLGTLWKQNQDFLVDGIEKTGGQHVTMALEIEIPGGSAALESEINSPILRYLLDNQMKIVSRKLEIQVCNGRDLGNS